MIPAPSWTRAAIRTSSAPLRWLLGWGRILEFGAAILVLALSPSSYDRETLCALVTLVITRIVVVTAYSYGLSQYALEMVVRVLVLELIPLTAALFVALRCTIPNGAALAEMRRTGRFDAQRAQGVDPVVREVLPRMLAGIFSTVTLAALSCMVAIVLAYLAVYAFTVAGVPAFTRMFGRVFAASVAR